MGDYFDNVVIGILNEIEQEKMIMKINPEQLAKDIEALPSICKEGKDAIKKLFENSFDVKFELPLREYSIIELKGKVFKVGDTKYTSFAFNLDAKWYVILIDASFSLYWISPQSLSSFHRDVHSGKYVEVK